MTSKLFTAHACLWRDKVNGNTYHSVRITRHSDGETIACPLQYGYGDQYRQTALQAMSAAGWLPEQYSREYRVHYEMDNGYPIIWTVSNDLKRDAIANGEGGQS